MKISRILMVGSDKVFAIENYYLKYLKASGIDVIHLSARSIFYDHYQRNFVNKIFFRLGVSAVYKKINKQFKEAVLRFRPEIIWVFKGMELFPASLVWAKSNAILVNYNADNPFFFMGKGSGNRNLTDSLGLYDLHLTYNHSVKSRLEQSFNVKVALLPFGFDVDEELFQCCQDQEEIRETCFLGNPERQRAGFIHALAELGVGITLYGNDWSKFISHPLVIINKPVEGLESWKVLRRYRVQLNLMRVHNEDAHNMRTFQVPAIGGIMVAPDTPDHRTFFEDGKEVFLFSDVADCAEKIKMIMSLSRERANRIRHAARMRSTTSGYSYRDRTAQVLSEMKQL
ncbi:MAG TPA: glycosyltransferase [Cyclobacteriaceae bacterium]|nr:glycosyltransferase [Cyclobacteriaceae bacterium]